MVAILYLCIAEILTHKAVAAPTILGIFLEVH